MRQLFDLEVLEQHGYTFDNGKVIGPPSWPRGAPPRLGSAPAAFLGGVGRGLGGFGVVGGRRRLHLAG